MDIKKLDGMSVIHSKYGQGVVCNISEFYIDVKFAEDMVKQFRYPDAFHGFLKVEDEGMMHAIETDYEKCKGENSNVNYIRSKENYESFKRFVKEKEEEQQRREQTAMEKQRQAQLMRAERMKNFQKNS